MSMRKDELRWIIIIAEVLREFRAAHSDLDVLANFKVKMRIVKPMRIAQGRDLLTASHRFAAMDEDFLQMRVERIDISGHPGFVIFVKHTEDVDIDNVALPGELALAIADAV